MAHFSPDFLQFFIDLAPNNHKEWFDENRQRYHKNVKEPFENFVDALIEALKPYDKGIPEDLTYKNCVFRINRDIRFSKDKTPYKMNRSAVIGPQGKNDHGIPSLYFEAGPEHFRIYTGVYSPQKHEIESIRHYIADHSDELNKIIIADHFKKEFGEVKGDKYKVLPKAYKAVAEKQPLILNKNWYVFKTYDPKVILQEDLIDIVVNDFKTIQPFQDYFRNALGIK